MKPGIHPEYRPVVFQDANTGAQFLTRSTITGSRTIDWETPSGVQHLPLVVVDISSDSHPFWTGSRRTLDTAGRVEKFHRATAADNDPHPNRTPQPHSENRIAREGSARSTPSRCAAAPACDYAVEKTEVAGHWGATAPGNADV